MSDTQVFCRMLRERSQEHRRAIVALVKVDTPSQMVAILRQELDSMVRVIYLLSQSSSPYRASLISASVAGTRWKREVGRGFVSDRDMVDLAQGLHGWTQSVYQFGCAFIHLSRFHDHGRRDPFRALPVSERENILKHLRYHHGGPRNLDPGFSDLVPLLPRVFDKIASNLESYIRSLEQGGQLP